jgi:hypothetical protein
MKPPLGTTRRTGRLGAAMMWTRLRPDLTLESALAALDDVVRSEDVERVAYRHPPRHIVRTGHLVRAGHPER